MSAWVLLLCAAALWLWPSAEVRRRCRAVAGDRGQSGVGFRPRWMAFATVPVVAVLFGGAAAVAAGIVGALWFRRSLRAQRSLAAERADDELRRALVVMTAELRVGAPVVGACRAAVGELTGDGRGSSTEVSRALSRMAAHAELGGELCAEAGDPAGVRRLAAHWRISAEGGLPMVELIEALRRDVVARREFAERTRAGLAGPRATSMVLAGLPLLGVGLGQLMGARPLAVLLRPGVGGVLLVIGVGLAAAGVVWSDAIVERVLR